MGESPREQAASAQSSIFNQQSNNMQGSAMSRFAEMKPYISQALQSLDTGFSSQIGALRSAVGSNLVSSGVAPGNEMTGSYLSSVAPAIAEAQKAKAGVQMSIPDILMKLFGQEDQSIYQFLMGGAQSIGMMKDSTPLGDVLGGGQTLANVFAGFTGKGKT
jgi:hypothetical protein